MLFLPDWKQWVFGAGFVVLLPTISGCSSSPGEDIELEKCFRTCATECTDTKKRTEFTVVEPCKPKEIAEISASCWTKDLASYCGGDLSKAHIVERGPVTCEPCPPGEDSEFLAMYRQKQARESAEARAETFSIAAFILSRTIVHPWSVFVYVLLSFLAVRYKMMPRRAVPDSAFSPKPKLGPDAPPEPDRSPPVKPVPPPETPDTPEWE